MTTAYKNIKEIQDFQVSKHPGVFSRFNKPLNVPLSLRPYHPERPILSKCPTYNLISLVPV